MTANAMSLEAGVRLGPYEIVSCIATGTVADLYQARDTRLHRRVAIKIFSREYGSDPDLLLRFESEVRSASQLEHPNIVSVFDVGNEGRLPYIVMEFLEGRTLASVLEQRRLTIHEVLEIASGIARGLAAAHQKRIAHRELKPENVFLTDGGQLKILGFGLAGLTQQEWARATSGDTASLVTRPDVVIGTAAYMSPEQVQGAAIDVRTDIFSFGAIVYQMLTGRPPFAGASVVETMTAIIRDQPDRIDGRCGPELIAIVNRCLSKRPEARFASAGEILFALEQTSSISGSLARQARRATSVPIGKLALLAGVLATVTLLITGVPRTRATDNALDAVPRVIKAERVTTEGHAYEAVLSPNGAYAAYLDAAYPYGWPRLRHIASGSDLQLLPRSEGRLFRPRGFSADGNFIYLDEWSLSGRGHLGSPLYSSVGVVRLPLLGGAPQNVLAGQFSKLRVSPDGRKVAFVRWNADQSAASLIVADAILGNERLLADIGGKASVLSQPAWSSDSKRLLLMVLEEPKSASAQPIEFDLTTGARRTLTFCPAVRWVEDLESAPDGGWIMQERSQLWHVSPDGAKCAQVSDDRMRWSIGSSSADRRTLLAIGVQEEQNLFRVFPADQRPPERLTHGINTEDGWNGIAILADGRIVFPRNSTGRVTQPKHLWLLDSAGNMRQLTKGDTEDGEPVAAATGSTIVYRERREGKNPPSRLMLLDIEKNESRQLSSGRMPRNMSFSPDGRFVYFMEGAAGPVSRLQRVSVGGGPPEDVTPAGASCRFFRLSPDGRMVSCLAASGVLSIISMSDSSVVKSLALPRVSGNIRWLPDSSGITFCRRTLEQTTELWLLPLGGGEMRRLTHSGGVDDIGDAYTWAPDGRSYLFSRATEMSDMYLLHLGGASSAK